MAFRMTQNITFTCDEFKLLHLQLHRSIYKYILEMIYLLLPLVNDILLLFQIILNIDLKVIDHILYQFGGL